MKRLILFFALFTLATTATAMDLPPGKWWRRPEVIQMLTLTDDQQSRLEAISVRSANELIDFKGEVEKANVALRAELDQPQLNREAIRRAAVRVNDARARLFERELMMLVDMRAVLSETQWNRMRQTLERMPERPMQQRQMQQRQNMRRRQ
jgi:hypothetical protein